MPGARVVSGEHVTLRTAERSDVPFLQRAHANPELRCGLGWDVRSQADLENEFEEGEGHDERFVVCIDGSHAGPGTPDPDDVRRIGCVVAGTAERARSGISYWIAPEYQGEGYGAEAVSLAVDYLFDVYPHPAVSATVRPDNDASRALLESLGFVEEGRARKVAFWNGAYRDALRYSVLRSEWAGESD